METVERAEKSPGRSIRPTFTQWLNRQDDVRGLIGDLARFARAVCREAKCWPRRAANPESFIAHVTEHHMRKTRELNLTVAIRRGWEKYEEFLESGEPFYVQQGPAPLPDGERRIHRNFTIHPGTLPKIRVLARDGGVGTGRIIDLLVDRAYARR